MANSLGYKNLASGKYGSTILQKQLSKTSSSTGDYSYSWKFHILEPPVPKSVLTLDQYFQPIAKRYSHSISTQESSLKGLEASLSYYKQTSPAYSSRPKRMCLRCFGELDTMGKCRRCGHG